MKKIFIDTNVILDVTLHREDFLAESIQIWSDCELKKVQGFISAITLNNMYFIMRKQVGSTVALEYVKLILTIFTIVPLDETILRLAANLPHKDFDDAIQTFSAVQAKAECIITRDVAHFSKDYIPVISPKEYIELLNIN